ALPSTSSTSATTTLAPSLAKSRAVAAPIPEAAPVTMATLSSKRMGVSSELGFRGEQDVEVFDDRGTCGAIIGRAQADAREQAKENRPKRTGPELGRATEPERTAMDHDRGHRLVHLVGSIPLPDAETVFRTVCAALGPHLVRVPDGETGIRRTWIKFLQDVL